MQLVNRIKTLRHEKEFIKGLLQIFIFDMLLYILWVSYILRERDPDFELYTVFLFASGLLPILKLFLCFRLHQTLRFADRDRLKSVTDEMIQQEKKEAREKLDTIKNLYRQGKNSEAISYINEYIADSQAKHEYVTDCICINNIIDHYNKVAEFRGITFKYDVPEKLHDLECGAKISRKALNTFLGNFLDNGVEALMVSSKEHKIISLDIRSGKNFIIYRVSNNGKKIKDVAKIFEPRFSTKGTRRGYGLVASERAISSIGGSINVESTDYQTSFEVVVNL